MRYASIGTLALTTMLAAPGSLTIEIRRLPAALAGGALFLDEVALLEHAGQLDDALELDFTPASAHVRGAKRPGQALGREAQLLLRQRELAELGRDRAERALAILVDAHQVRLETVERFADRLEHALGVLTKLGSILFQRVFGEGGERVAELRAGVGRGRALVLGRLAGGGEVRFEAKGLAREVLLPEEARDRDQRRDRGYKPDANEPGQAKHARDCTPVV